MVARGGVSERRALVMAAGGTETIIPPETCRKAGIQYPHSFEPVTWCIACMDFTGGGNANYFNKKTIHLKTFQSFFALDADEFYWWSPNTCKAPIFRSLFTSLKYRNSSAGKDQTSKIARASSCTSVMGRNKTDNVSRWMQRRKHSLQAKLDFF